jgi:hypothetical protein
MLLLLAVGCAGGDATDTTSEPADAGDTDMGDSAAPDADGDGVPATRDCDDADPTVFPGADEYCNGHDDDCDGQVDEYAVDRITIWPDLDQDGWGRTGSPTDACEVREWYVTRDGDCDDEDATTYPGAPETSDDGIDQDCDGWDVLAACPDAAHIDDDVTIDGDDAEADAEALCAAGPVRIGGGLVVSATPFTDLSALGCVCTAEWIRVEDNPSLENLDGLALVALDDARVDDNPRLTSIAALGRLPALDALNVWGNAIATLAPLRDTRVTEAQIDDEDALVDLDGLSVLADLYVRRCDALVSFAGLQHEGYAFNVEVTDNASLASLEGLEGLDSAYRVDVDGNASLHDLRGLDGLTSANDVYIHDGALTSLAGLDALTAVEGLTVLHIPSLTTLDGLGALESGDLAFTDVGITDTAGLRSLAEGMLTFEDDPALTTIAAPSLTSTSLVVERNPSLTSFALPNLAWADAITIDDDDALPSLDGLDALATVGDLTITDNASLTTLAGLGSLTTVSGALDVSDDPSLIAVDGLTALASAGDVAFVRDPALTSFDGFAASDLGSLTIEFDDALTDLTGLDSLTTVTGDVVVRDNAALVSLAGLGGLQTAGEVDIQDEPALTDLSGLASLTTVDTFHVFDTGITTLAGPPLATVDDYALERDSSLRNLDGFGAPAIGTWLKFYDCDALTDLAGLASLTTIDGSLVFDDDDALTTLAGTEALRTINESLWIENNDGLTDVSALEGVEWLGNDFIVRDNPALATADVLALGNAIDHMGGSAIVSGNGP